MRLVPWNGLDVHPVTGIAFYVSSDGRYGVRVYPDGRKALQPPCTTHTSGSKGTDGRRKQHYLYFRDAWGHHISILVAHAVSIAWNKKRIKKGQTADHIDGCTTNNDYRNLRVVSLEINMRDGAFSRKLKKVGIDPTTLQRWMILRYFKRMVRVKKALSEKQYRTLSLTALRYILEAPNFRVKKLTLLISGR